MRPSRRTFLRSTGWTILAPAIGAIGQLSVARTQPVERCWQHGIALFGDLKYPATFAHFDYVNPSAPKGGIARQSVTGTFDNFNPVIAGLKGRLADGTGYIFEKLLVPALDEEASGYGLVAEAVSFPEDRAWVSYRLRAEAKWHDGHPITPDDVIFSFDAFKTNNPTASAYYGHVAKAERTGDREITFTFDRPNIRELPQAVGGLTVVPKHWFEGLDKDGRKRNVAATMLEVPLASGAYRIKSFEAGHSIVYERNPDYWGRNLNVRIGRDNFNELRIEYFRDTTGKFEAFKAGEVDWHVESGAKSWATGYEFPAVQDKRVIKEEFPIHKTGIMQSCAFNLRRPKFADPRLRQAFNWALDFESINNQLFHGQYTRIASYFEGTKLASSGLPQGLELEILDSVRSEVPAEVFTTAYTNPIGGTPHAVRANLREATRLLDAAGYIIRDLKLIDKKTGEPFTVEFLVPDPSYGRFVLFYSENLKRLGVGVTLRIVDGVQYENRLRQWDYDIIIDSWTESLTPGNELNDYFGSEAASKPGSRNSVGIKNTGVDALIARVIGAKDREDLSASAQALDRVLLWNHFVVPQWTYSKTRIARWDRFGKPNRLPEFGQPAFPTIWWWNGAHAAKASRS
jgi:microcin C transport system substrate-binding protein